jgi:hypothetical protein
VQWFFQWDNEWNNINFSYWSLFQMSTPLKIGAINSFLKLIAICCEACHNGTSFWEPMISLERKISSFICWHHIMYLCCSYHNFYWKYMMRLYFFVSCKWVIFWITKNDLKTQNLELHNLSFVHIWTNFKLKHNWWR